MQETQLARAVAELGGLTRQLGYSTEVVVACCDAAVHDVRKVFTAAQLELYGGGGTDIGAGLRWFTERKSGPIDLLVIVTDCQTPWPEDTPPFPGDHHSRRRRRPATLGQYRREPSDYNRGAEAPQAHVG